MANLQLAVLANSVFVGMKHTIKGYIARDLIGALYLYKVKPDKGRQEWMGNAIMELPTKWFKNQTFSKEPRLVEITAIDLV